MSVLTPEQAREWCAAEMDMVRNRVLIAGFVQHMRDSVPKFLDGIDDLTAQLANARRDAFNEIATIADALASQQGIKSELAEALRERIDGAL